MNIIRDKLFYKKRITKFEEVTYTRKKQVIMKENYSKNGLNANLSQFENKIQTNKRNVRNRKAKGQFAIGMINELNRLENDLNNFQLRLRKKNRRAYFDF